MSNVTVTVSRLDRRTVRVTADYPRLGTMDLTLSRSGRGGAKDSAERAGAPGRPPFPPAIQTPSARPAT